MTVDALGSQNALLGAQGVPDGHHRHHDASRLQSVATTLGMDVKDVAAALRNGTSLEELAQQKGVSHDDLVAAIKAGLPPAVQQSGRADRIAEAIAARKAAPRAASRPDVDDMPGVPAVAQAATGAPVSATQLAPGAQDGLVVDTSA